MLSMSAVSFLYEMPKAWSRKTASPKMQQAIN